MNSKNNMKEWDLIITQERAWFSLNLSEIFHYKDLLWLFVKEILQHFISRQS